MKAPPEPLVSGRYFWPKAPLLCWNRIPAAWVTSVNSIGVILAGPVGDGDAVFEGVAEAAAGFESPDAAVPGCSAAGAGDFRQALAENERIAINQSAGQTARRAKRTGLGTALIGISWR